MFVAVSGAGLMLTAKIVSFAQELGFAAGIATISATLLPISGGVGRLVMGDISDRVNRKYAMAISFLLCGLGLLSVTWFGLTDRSLWFIIAVIVATFFWSPQYTLFPSVVGDYYGQRHSSANYALLYSGKMWGGIFGGVITGWLISITSWSTVFALGGLLAVAAGLCAFILTEPR
jgi:OFA family oxalate/formate antiporter-like MFS transporter